MDRAHYHYNRYMGLILSNNPEDMEIYTVLLPDSNPYVLFIDKRRMFANIKELFLKRLLKIIEKERTYAEPFYIRTLLLFRKQCTTISEMLAN